MKDIHRVKIEGRTNSIHMLEEVHRSDEGRYPGYKIIATRPLVEKDMFCMDYSRLNRSIDLSQDAMVVLYARDRLFDERIDQNDTYLVTKENRDDIRHYFSFNAECIAGDPDCTDIPLEMMQDIEVQIDELKQIDIDALMKKTKPYKLDIA